MKVKRVFLIVLDSLGIGELPDAKEFGDEGSNTLATIMKSDRYQTPVMERLGLFAIDGIKRSSTVTPQGIYGRLAELSKGKDTTTGHWEIAGIISAEPMPVYPQGFPDEVMNAFSEATGRGWLCNRPYSGTEVIREYGREHMESGKFIVYTSADSVFQIAAHEDVVPLEELYQACRKAREILTGEHGVGRVIARPFNGIWPDFTRTSGRHDYSLLPPAKTMLDHLHAAGLSVLGVGKISDIFAGQGITQSYPISGNADGMKRTEELLEKEFTGLCFVNLVDFDMLYGHRNDIAGYAGAVTEFDRWLGSFLDKMDEEDVLMITADHGCDPGTESTDHSREYTFLLGSGAALKNNVSLAIRDSFADISATILDMLEVPGETAGESFWNEIRR